MHGRTPHVWAPRVQFLGMSGSAGPWTRHQLCPLIPAGSIPGVRPGGPPWPCATVQWERQAWGTAVPRGPERGVSEAERRPVREGRCHHRWQWVPSVRETAGSSWRNIFVHLDLDNHQSDFLDVSATQPASPEHHQPTAMSLRERLSLQACPVRQQPEACSRNLLAHGALINPVGLSVMSPKKLLDGCFPGSQIKGQGSGRLLNY